MSLYGYGRDTTPQLNAIRDELVVLMMLFLLGLIPLRLCSRCYHSLIQSALKPFEQPTLLNIMKKRVKITWITNQQTQTRRNTMLTTLSQLADQQVYQKQ